MGAKVNFKEWLPDHQENKEWLALLVNIGNSVPRQTQAASRTFENSYNIYNRPCLSHKYFSLQRTPHKATFGESAMKMRHKMLTTYYA